MQDLLSLFPFVEKSKNDFEKENKLLYKVTLTGKINADKSTTNLFEFAEDTNQKFSALKESLIKILLEENITTVVNQLKLKAQVTIDIFNRNLFERTADVGFLATDSQIIDFLKEKDISIESLKSRLDAYVSKYSVYNEIIIFDTKGKVKVNFNPNNNITSTNDRIIKETLEADSYLERYASTDIFKKQEKTLTYTQKIMDGNTVLGVLCLCFKFEDEFERICKNLQSKNQTILLIQNNQIIASSKPQHYKEKESYTIDMKKKYTLLKKTFAVPAKTQGYQGYYGLPWYAVIIQDTKIIPKEIDTPALHNNLMSQNIKNLIDNADDIIADLADIIINGELIAAKRRMYILNPILDNLRIISVNLLRTIKEAASNLESLMYQSLKFTLESSSALAIDIMDRNLYERANNSRWWALTPLFINELSSQTPNVNNLNATLENINDLYTVYTNILVYDKNGKVIASSKDKNTIGKIIHGNEVSKTLQNKHTQKYFVSSFQTSEYYNNEATYLYHASINSSKSTIGGIAVVFDSSVEFLTMLKDSFPTHLKGFSIFIDKNGMIISSTNEDLKVTSIFDIDENILKEVINKHTFYGTITFNEKSYFLSSTSSQGYREYKVNDNYINNIIALTLVEV